MKFYIRIAFVGWILSIISNLISLIFSYGILTSFPLLWLLLPGILLTVVPFTQYIKETSAFKLFSINKKKYKEQSNKTINMAVLIVFLSLVYLFVAFSIKHSYSTKSKGNNQIVIKNSINDPASNELNEPELSQVVSGFFVGAYALSLGALLLAQGNIKAY